MQSTTVSAPMMTRATLRPVLHKLVSDQRFFINNFVHPTSPYVRLVGRNAPSVAAIAKLRDGLARVYPGRGAEDAMCNVLVLYKEDTAQAFTPPAPRNGGGAAAVPQYCTDYERLHAFSDDEEVHQLLLIMYVGELYLLLEDFFYALFNDSDSSDCDEAVEPWEIRHPGLARMFCSVKEAADAVWADLAAPGSPEELQKKLAVSLARLEGWA